MFSLGPTYTFPALRGIQAGREYYVAMCPLKLLPTIFIFDEVGISPELRAQRTLNTSRIPEISRYLIENRQDYVLSAITASIDGEVHFESTGVGDSLSSIGYLVVPMSARFLINDGQHRRAAIEATLKEDPSLGNETIAVVFFQDTGLYRSQQLFADLNKHAVRPSQSIGVLYDYRDPLACLIRELVEVVPCFKGLIELEKTTISNRSIKLFTLSSIYQATGELLAKKKHDSINGQDKEVAIRFWQALCRNIPEWQLVIRKQASSAELRRDYVHAHSVVLHALGIAGHGLIRQFPDSWESHLEKLKAVDWSRKNTTVWEGRAMLGGHMSKARQNITQTASYIKIVLGVELSSSEKDNTISLEVTNTSGG